LKGVRILKSSNWSINLIASVSNANGSFMYKLSPSHVCHSTFLGIKQNLCKIFTCAEVLNFSGVSFSIIVLVASESCTDIENKRGWTMKWTGKTFLG